MKAKVVEVFSFLAVYHQIVLKFIFEKKKNQHNLYFLKKTLYIFCLKTILYISDNTRGVFISFTLIQKKKFTVFRQ